MSTTPRPVPAPDPATRPYWDAAQRGELKLPKCGDCGKFHFYPRTFCPHCGSAKLAWEASAGQGEIYTFTVVQRAPSPAFEAEVPYVVAVVALDEGPHLMSNIVNVAPDAVRVGQRVRVSFKPIGEGEALPVFEPCD